MDRRTFQLGLGAAALLVASGSRAQGSSTRILVGFSPGGSADTMARLLAEGLQRHLNRTFIVENRPGASGRLVPEQVAGATPDGQTLMIVPHGPMALFPSLYSKLRYDAVRSFTPIARLSTFDYALIANPALDVPNAQALKRWLQSAGTKASYGSPGAGTVPHFLGVSVARSLNVTMPHVPYRGGAPAMVDLVGGVIPLVISPMADAAELARAGKVKFLATSGPRRNVATPSVPTFKEYGIDVEMVGWFGLYGPAGLSNAQVSSLQQAVGSVLAESALRERLARFNLDAAASTPAELASLQQRESAYWPAVVKASGFTPED